MSRDATGIWTGWAIQRVTCPVCGAAPGVQCDLDKGQRGHVEHDTHFERTEADSGEIPPENIVHVEPPMLVSLEGDYECSLPDWLEANTELPKEDRISVINLEPGEEYRGGGGAGASWGVRRIR